MWNFLITDIDGTIIDRMPIYRDAFIKTILSVEGVEKLKPNPAMIGKYYYDTAGAPISDQIRDGIKEVYGRKLEEKSLDYLPVKKAISDRMINRLVAHFFELAGRVEPELFPDAKEILARVSKRLIIAGTSGSKTSELKALLMKKHGLPFECVIGSDHVKKGVRHIELLAEMLGCPYKAFCRDSVYLGDGPADMDIAKQCGIYRIGITHTVPREKLLAAGANQIINSLSELPRVLNI